jgi:hypothetical protein
LGIRLTDIGYGESLSIDDLAGDKEGRAWYGEVIFFFQVTVPGADHAAELVKYDFAWVQWYETFGLGPGRRGRRYVDPNFPPALRKPFPRIFLPEVELGATFECVPVSDIISPAPVSDDISIMWDTPESIAYADHAQGIRRRNILQGFPALNSSLLPEIKHCRCEDPECERYITGTLFCCAI